MDAHGQKRWAAETERLWELGCLTVWQQQSKIFDCLGLAPNRKEAIVGAGGGCYVPIGMRDITGDWSPEQETAIKELWGGALPMGSEDHGLGNVIRYWDCPAEYFTIVMPMLMADREDVVHNLCQTLCATDLVDPGVHQAAGANGLSVRRLVCEGAEGSKEGRAADAQADESCR